MAGASTSDVGIELIPAPAPPTFEMTALILKRSPFLSRFVPAFNKVLAGKNLVVST
jgi:hypothetical protein